MTTLELKYNSFAVKTDFFINGREASLKCFGTGDKVRLRDYIDGFFPEAIKKSNVGPGTECIIQFYGTQDAFEDVRKSYDDYMAQAAEGMNIKLPEYKPYPNSNNFQEMNKLIDNKRDFFSDQIKRKREELINPTAGKNNVELTDVIKRFDRDKKNIEQITYRDCLDKANYVIEKAKEGVDFNVSSEPMNNLDCTFSVYNTTNGGTLTINANKVKFYDSDNYVVENEYFKLYYVKIIEQIELTYTKACGELTDFLGSLFEKINTEIYSGVEAVYKEYTVAYSDSLALNYPLQKYKQNNSLGIKEVIPDSYFSSMEIKETLSTARIGVALINERIEKVISSCQEYFNFVFEIAKQAFHDEAEKCKTYYLEQLQELQETVKEKLSSTKQIEEEITALENRIVGLNALQSDIIKLAVT